MYQLLLGIRSSGLENDALLEIFYEMTGEKYRSDHEYGIFVFHDRYDIPAKAADHVRLVAADDDAVGVGDLRGLSGYRGLRGGKPGVRVPFSVICGRRGADELY